MSYPVRFRWMSAVFTPMLLWNIRFSSFICLTQANSTAKTALLYLEKSISSYVSHTNSTSDPCISTDSVKNLSRKDARIFCKVDELLMKRGKLWRIKMLPVEITSSLLIASHYQTHPSVDIQLIQSFI